MCLIIFGLEVHPKYKLVLMANRDEFYERSTQPASWWEDSPQVLAGRDLVAGGTWIGVSQSGKLTAITNYRDPAHIKQQAPSRGDLTAHYLKDSVKPLKYMMHKQFTAWAYNGFNLLAGDIEDLFYFSNYSPAIQKIDAGIHGLSNHLLNTPWPKVEKGKQKLKNYIIENEDLQVSQIFDLLHDPELAPDDSLPSTGVPYEWEKVLSSMFIESPTYGTCSSTVILWDYENHITFAEKIYNPLSKNYLKEQVFTLKVSG